MSENLITFPSRQKIEALAQKYSLLLPERQKASLIGELSGKRTGSSIEYQDRKDYVLGDDIRHIDWRAFARTDRLTVKLYREEICPTVDIIVDTSLSMSVTPEKSLRRMELAYLFYLLSLKIHALTALYNLGENLRRFRNPLDLLTMKDMRQDTPLPLLQDSPFARRGGVKILISDFLFPFSPAELIATFSAADCLILAQVVSAFEDNPGQGEFIRLVDAENTKFLDVVLNRATVEGYKKRLNNLRSEMERRARVAFGAFACLRDEETLDEVVHNLLTAGVINVK